MRPGQQHRAVNAVVLAYSWLFLTFNSAGLFAQTVTLGWDVNPDPTVVGYRVYYGPASGYYTNAIDAGTSTKATVSGLVPGGMYFLAATDYTNEGVESDFSTEIAYAVPAAPTNPPPTLDPLTNLVLASGSGQFVVLNGISSGVSNSAQKVSVTAVSSNPGLVPDPQLIYSSPSASGIMLVSSTFLASGQANVAVTVRDTVQTNLAVTKVFNVTVEPPVGPGTSNGAPASLHAARGLPGGTGAASFALTGTTGRIYRVEFSSSPHSTNWETLMDVTILVNPVTWEEPQSVATTNRFYRAVLMGN